MGRAHTPEKLVCTERALDPVTGVEGTVLLESQAGAELLVTVRALEPAQWALQPLNFAFR